MITKNFEDYPEHRLKFFSLLQAIATHCFPALIRLSSEVCDPMAHSWCSVFKAPFLYIQSTFQKYIDMAVISFSKLIWAYAGFWCFFLIDDQQVKLVMDSIVWAFRHTERNIAETGLNLLLEMLKNFQVLADYWPIYNDFCSMWLGGVTIFYLLAGIRVR